MKPSWDDAPEWANYLTMDRNKCWWWHQTKPVCIDDSGVWNSSFMQMIPAPRINWKETLENRPS